jgi:hypothetical protein
MLKFPWKLVLELPATKWLPGLLHGCWCYLDLALMWWEIQQVAASGRQLQEDHLSSSKS